MQQKCVDNKRYGPSYDLPINYKSACREFLQFFSKFMHKFKFNLCLMRSPSNPQMYKNHVIWSKDTMSKKNLQKNSIKDI